MLLVLHWAVDNQDQSFLEFERALTKNKHKKVAHLATLSSPSFDSWTETSEKLQIKRKGEQIDRWNALILTESRAWDLLSLRVNEGGAPLKQGDNLFSLTWCAFIPASYVIKATTLFGWTSETSPNTKAMSFPTQFSANCRKMAKNKLHSYQTRHTHGPRVAPSDGLESTANQSIKFKILWKQFRRKVLKMSPNPLFYHIIPSPRFEASKKAFKTMEMNQYWPKTSLLGGFGLQLRRKQPGVAWSQVPWNVGRRPKSGPQLANSFLGQWSSETYQN